MSPRRHTARTLAVALLMCAAAVLALFAAAVRSRSGTNERNAALEQELCEQLGSAPQADAESADDAARILGSAEADVRKSDKEVADAAVEVLEGYEGRQDCVLARAGYLGLFAGSWGCLSYGGDWSEVCLVTGAEDGGSEVRTWRITSAEVEALGDG
ncbi:hypothetical protein [Paratractidigestivibacter sp.]|uniref:hypothetical protein n=1 Tax=Paratractidigestivibacter sp. TaxID=2847316 RepID=UPI002ABE9D53|nr:hypothetical protein [Paratractidigestivibacter sp.]